MLFSPGRSVGGLAVRYGEEVMIRGGVLKTNGAGAAVNFAANSSLSPIYYIYMYES